MFGWVRLMLAAAVALSHVGVRVAGYNPGPTAVIQFYLISGFVTATLLDSQFARAGDYYIERAIRLLPGYWVALGVAALIWAAAGPGEIPFLQKAPHWSDWISNVTIVPLNFYMWSGEDQFTLIPPAWSLAAEFQFYALAPLILCLRPSLRAVTLMASFAIWLTAVAGGLQTDWWGYRLLPGILFVFMLGASIGRGEWTTVWGISLVAVFVFSALMAGGIAAEPFNVETSLGLVIGVPIVISMSHMSRRKWDDAIGRLAYPMFLLHFPVMWVFGAFGYPAAAIAAGPWLLVFWLVCTVIASWLLFIVTERPMMRLRHSLRHTLPLQSRAASPSPAGGGG